MKLKNIITLSILLALSFSIMHEFTFAKYDKEHCSVSEYISELKAPNNCGDICDIHFEYHQAYMFPPEKISIQNIDKTSEKKLHKESYKFLENSDLIKPPIA